MAPIIFFAAVLLVPLAAAFFLRVNAAILFMSLCVGAVLVQYVSNDSATIFSALSPHGNISDTTVKLVLILLPPALTTLFMYHSVTGQAKKLANLVPAVGVGVLAALLLEPLLSVHLQTAIESSKIWQQFIKAQTFAVAASAFFSLAFLWFQKHGSSSGKETKHKPHSKKSE